MAAFSARNARVIYEGLALLALKWTVNVKADELDVSNMESQGYADFIGGLWEADISIDAIVDSANAAFYIWPGKSTSTVTFYFDSGTARKITNNNQYDASTTAKTIAFNSLFISSVNVDAEVRGFVRMSISAKNKGYFQMPAL